MTILYRHGGGHNFIDLLHFLRVYDMWAQWVAGQPVIQPKAGAVEGRGVDGQHAREFNAVCTSHIKAPRQSNLRNPTHLRTQGQE